MLTGMRKLSREEEYSEDGGRVVQTVPTCMQNYSWDCGLACASMTLKYLGHNTNKVYTTDLEALQCGESIWTIDLAALMRRYGIQHKLCTITLGVDKGYSKQAFYSGKFSYDEQRVSKLFQEAAKLELNVEQRSVPYTEILSHVQTGNVVIVLVDWNQLECLWCDRLSCQSSCFSCVSSRCCSGYQGKCVYCSYSVQMYSHCTFNQNSRLGHYVVVCGYDRKKKRIFYKNPSYDEDLCCSRFDKFDLARKSYGTDEDILFVYRDGVS